jgi:hypothetical protein
MNARADQMTAPTVWRWLAFPPAFGWALATTLIDAFRRRACEITVPRMSDQWLREHDASSYDG